MRKLIFCTVTMLFATVLQLHAQYCGTSGSFVCTPSGTIDSAGYFDSEGVPCIVRGQNTDVVLQFKNVDILYRMGIPISVDSLRIDSIGQLPEGLCWSTNTIGNKFNKAEEGCIRFTGTTNAPAGQYKLYMTFFAHVNFLGMNQIVNGISDSFDVKIYLRVINTAGSICPPIVKGQLNPYDPPLTTYDSLVGLTGKVFYDANQNNVYDIGEKGRPNQWVDVGGYTAVTNANGDYYAYVPPGNYTINPLISGTATQFTYTPDSIILHADSMGINYPSNNFSVIVPSNFCEGSLSIINIARPPRPGFDNDLQLIFWNNISGTPVTQSIRLYYSSMQGYVSAVPAPAVVDNINGFLEWDVNNIGSGSGWAADIKMNTKVGAQIGDVVRYTSSIFTSTCALSDNLTTIQEFTVVGSYDPNDKAVSPVGYGNQHGVNPNLDPQFTYTVRFQNTGTYLAENVTLVDTISPHLNLSTLKVLSASHDYQVTIEGRTVKFWFKQIDLPDSNSNEPLSHGYIQYAIQPYTSLAQNIVINNRADIYFDFNPPVLTNTTLTTIDYVDHSVGISEAAKGNSFVIYPNPASGILHYTVAGEIVGKDIKVLDVSGRLLINERIENTTSTISIQNLTSGIYFVKIGSVVKKLLKE